MAQKTDTSEQESSTETRELSALDVDAVVSLSDRDGRFRLADCKQPQPHGDVIWALVDAQTGAFAGLVQDGAGLQSDPVLVEFHSYDGREQE
jgi:hypothetical protein